MGFEFIIRYINILDQRWGQVPPQLQGHFFSLGLALFYFSSFSLAPLVFHLSASMILPSAATSISPV